MTGYGRSEAMVGDKKIVVEIRSLNSKGLDLSLKIPQVLREREMPLRKRLSNEVMRGKAEIGISIEGGADKKATINHELAAAYHAQVTSMAADLGIDVSKEALAGLLLKMPEVLQPERAEMSETEWESISQMISEATARFDDYRLEEGRKLEADLMGNIDSIVSLREKVAPYIDGRIDRIKERIHKNLDQVMEGRDVNMDRLEQEIVFYIEKYDVSEEMSRLAGHLEYFKESIAAEDGGGKKLGFISQEIGREINTLGAKAYDADMQRVVVEMKDALEKIKEQVFNVL